MLLRRSGQTQIIGASVAMALVLATVTLTAAPAGAASLRGQAGVVVDRCGYTNAEYGRSAVYPWRISCSGAETVIHDSAKPSDNIGAFSPGWDGGVVKVGSQKWVCTGQMGDYECGYPYRPYDDRGSHGYKGPFTKDVQWTTCKVVGQQSCATTATFTQPRRRT